MNERSATVFFDCRDCGWSTGANNQEWAIDIIVERIRDHLMHDSRHLGLSRVSAEVELANLIANQQIRSHVVARKPEGDNTCTCSAGTARSSCPVHGIDSISASNLAKVCQLVETFVNRSREMRGKNNDLAIAWAEAATDLAEALTINNDVWQGDWGKNE